MKSVIRILRSFVVTTIIIAIFLLVLNFVLLGNFLFKGMEGHAPKNVVQKVATELEGTPGNYGLDNSVKKLLTQNKAWAMLIDNKGQVSWDYELPEEIPLNYTLRDIAKLSRFYLKDYPVFVWEHDDGLVVVGYPQTSYAKYQLYFPVSWISSLPVRSLALLIGNIALALLLSVLIGTRLIRSLKPLLGGVHDLAQEKPVQLETKGIFQDLAKSINQTSKILQKKNKALKKRDEARYNWIAGISHDIRTPLSMVLGYAGELEENKVLPEEQREQAGIIRQQGEKLRVLIQDLNLVSMLEYEMQPLNIKTLFLSALARQVAADFVNNGLDEKYVINLELAQEDIKVKGDEKLLLRALTNLVQNSITHNPQGCEILLKTCISLDSETCSFIVADRGKGISQDKLSDLLELPYSAQRKHAVAKGHGLGLPMVSKIAQAHKGKLILKSRPGEGLEAIINLPVVFSPEQKQV